MNLLIAIVAGIVAIFLFIVLLGVALKLIAIIVGLAIAVAAYFLIERLVGQGR